MLDRLREMLLPLMILVIVACVWAVGWAQRQVEQRRSYMPPTPEYARYFAQVMSNESS